jgi:hypothetical protein
MDAEATTGDARWPGYSGWRNAAAPVALQVNDEYDSHLYARAKGWKEKSIPITPDMKEAHITLDERQEPPPPPTTLKVILPPSKWLGGHFVFVRVLVRTADGREFWTCEAKEVGTENETTVELNLRDWQGYRMELTGGLRFGFRGGVLSGPHDLGLVPLQANEWRLDEWPDPPTTTPAPRRPIATCEGRRMEFNAPSRFQSGRIEVFDIGGVADSPIAVLDGSSEIPVPMVVDPVAGPQIQVDLPARIKVRRSSDHEPGDWAIYCETGDRTWPGATGESGYARAWFVDNEAWLWAPKGPVRLQVAVNNRIVQAWKFEIVDDRVHTFEVDESSADVKLEITTDNPEVRKFWFNSSSFQVMKPGTLGGQSAKPGQQLKLKPGSYVLVAPDELIADPVPFEAVAGETTVVRMKIHGEVSFDANAVLRTPVEGHVIVPQIRYTIDHLPGSPVATGRAMLQSEPEFHARQVPEGLLLHDLPRNCEFWLWGAASVGTIRYALIPMKVTVGDEQPIIEGKWVQLRRGSKDWRLSDAQVCWETPVGPAVWIERISAGTTWECAHPIGPARMSVRQGGEVIVQFETNLEAGTDPVDIPPDIAAKLREAGVLR